MAETDARGDARGVALPQGLMSILVTAPNHIAHERVLTLGPGTEEVIQLDAGRPLRFTVRDAESAVPIERAQVEVSDWKTKRQKLLSDNNGRVEFQVSSESGILDVSCEAPGYAVLRTHALASTPEHELVLERGSTMTLSSVEGVPDLQVECELFLPQSGSYLRLPDIRLQAGEWHTLDALPSSGRLLLRAWDSADRVCFRDVPIGRGGEVPPFRPYAEDPGRGTPLRILWREGVQEDADLVVSLVPSDLRYSSLLRQQIRVTREPIVIWRMPQKRYRAVRKSNGRSLGSPLSISPSRAELRLKPMEVKRAGGMVLGVDRLPLPGAFVVLYHREDERVAHATTDPSGRFDLVWTGDLVEGAYVRAFLRGHHASEPTAAKASDGQLILRMGPRRE